MGSPEPFRPHWSLFARTFALYLVITAVSVGIVGFLAVRVSNQHILDEVSTASSYALDSKRAIVEERLQKVNSIAFQTMYNASTFRLVWSENYGAVGLLIMRDLIDGFRTMVLAQDWMQSIYFYTSRTDYVLSDTKYSKNEFPDQEVLRLSAADGVTELGPRKLGSDTVITFVRTFSFFGNNATGTVVINVFYDRFFSEFPADRQKPAFAVFSTDRDLVYPATLPRPFPSLASVVGSPRTVSVLPAGAPGNSYLVAHERSLYRPWIYVYYRPYAEVVRPASLVRRIIVITLLGVLAMAVLTLWAATRRLQEPLTALVRWTRGVVGDNDPSVQDEYELVRTALRRLLSENLSLSERYKVVFPYFRRHSLTELLHTRNWDVARFETIVELLGLRLTRSRFHTALFELQGTGDGSATLRRSIESLLADWSSTLAAVAAGEDARRVALVINTDAGTEEILAVMEHVRESLWTRGIRSVVSLSHSFGNLAELPDHFSETEEQIRHQAFFGTEKVIYDSNRLPRPEAPAGRARETDIVVSAVRANDPRGLAAALEQFERVVSSAGQGSIGDARFAWFSLADTLQSLLPAHDPGARQAVFRGANEASSSQELMAMVSAQARAVMERLDALRRHQHSDTVRRAAAWIEEHLSTNISVDNVAEAVFLSARYLNSLFRSEMGQTVFEYISTLRIKRAETLLARPQNLRIQDVAHAVGYDNVQSFIRLFKRYHGVTPAEFRRSYTA